MKYILKTNQINIRDPFVLPYKEKYYMYGSRVGEQTGFDVYISEDLENWSEPQSVFERYEGFWGQKEFWAPEVHYYKERFYMFATFNAEGVCRGTAILVSDSPEGPFVEHSEGAVTPAEWECLDGTLYVSPEGKPYMVFCHEWLQIGDGTVCAMELTEDLKRPAAEPKVLWHASDAPWVTNLSGAHEKNHITDGPYLMTVNQQLMSLWSSAGRNSEGRNAYVQAIARSDDGTIDGNWIVDERLLYDRDGGHGMIFEAFSGEMMFVCHAPNSAFNERPVFRKITTEELISGE